MAARRPSTPHPREERMRLSSTSSSEPDTDLVITGQQLEDFKDQKVLQMSLEEVRSRVSQHLSRCYLRARTPQNPNSQAARDDASEGWRELQDLKFILQSVILKFS